MWSIIRHRTESIDVLLEHGADTEQINVWGRNALFLAAWEGDAHVVESLLAHGANVSGCASHDEWSPVHKASEMGHTGALRALCAYGADPYRRTLPDKNFADGVTAFEVASGEDVLSILNECEPSVATIAGNSTPCDDLAEDANCTTASASKDEL